MADELDIVVGVQVQANESDIQSQVKAKAGNIHIEPKLKLTDDAISKFVGDINKIVVNPVQVDIKVSQKSLLKARTDVKNALGSINGLDLSNLVGNLINPREMQNQATQVAKTTTAMARQVGQSLNGIHDISFDVDDIGEFSGKLRDLGLTAQEVKQVMAQMANGNFMPKDLKAHFATYLVEDLDAMIQKAEELGVALEEVGKIFKQSDEKRLERVSIGGKTATGVGATLQMRRTDHGFATSLDVNKSVEDQISKSEQSIERYKDRLGKMINQLNSLVSSSFNQKNPIKGERQTILRDLIDGLRADIEAAMDNTDNVDQVLRDFETRLSAIKDRRAELKAEQDATNDLATKSASQRIAEKSISINGSMLLEKNRLISRLGEFGGTVADRQSLGGSYGRLKSMLNEVSTKGDSAGLEDWRKLTHQIQLFDEACKQAQDTLSRLNREKQQKSREDSFKSNIEKTLANTNAMDRAKVLLGRLGKEGIASDSLNKAIKGYETARSSLAVNKTQENLNALTVAQARLTNEYNRSKQALQEKLDVDKQANSEAQKAKKFASDETKTLDRYRESQRKAAKVESELRKRGEDNAADIVKGKREQAEAEYNQYYSGRDNAADLETRRAALDQVTASTEAMEKATRSGGVAIGEFDERAKQAKSAADSIKQANVAMANFASSVAKGENAISKGEALGIDVGALKQTLADLNTAKQALEGDQSPQKLQAYRQAMVAYKTELDAVTTSIKEQDNAERSRHKAQMGRQEITKIRSQWTRAMQDINNVARLNMIEEMFSGGADDIAHATALLQEFKKEMRATGQATLSAGDQIKKGFNFLTTMFSGAQMFGYLRQFLSQAIQNTSDVDKSMVSLRKVTDATDAQYAAFLDNAETKAQQLSTTLTGLIDSTAMFGKLGYSLSEAAQLGQVSQMYANVGDIESAETAAQYLISTLNGFKLASNDAMSIIDKFNLVENNFAVTASGLGDALTRSAASLNVSNTSLEKSIALITAANTTVQDEATVGTALKTLSARIRGSKTELEELGEEQDEYAQSTSKLRNSIKSLTGVDIMIDKNTYKDIYDILQEISKVYDDLTDTSKANVQEILFGKLRGNIGAAILSNFDIAERAYDTAMNADGSALREYEIWLQSVEAKQQKMAAAFEAFSSSFIDSSLVGEGYDALAGLLNILEQIVDVLGSIPSLITAVVGALSATNIDFGRIMPCPG